MHSDVAGVWVANKCYKCTLNVRYVNLDIGHSLAFLMIFLLLFS